MHVNTGSMAEAISEICDVHGRFGDKVYRRKRNGEPWVYDYHFIPKYAPTVLSRRVDCIAKVAAALSNPRERGYSSIAKKIYYYTPYFVYAGNYDFTCNTFFKLRSKGDYKISFDGMSMNRHLSPRTKLNFWFDEEREYSINLYPDGKLYCQRRIIVIDDESDLEDTYVTWFFENLAEILALPEPGFRSMKIYRRGIIPNIMMNFFVGKTDQGVMYRSCFRNGFMYVRSSFEHHHSASGDHFYVSQKNITDWRKAASGDLELSGKSIFGVGLMLITTRFGSW